MTRCQNCKHRVEQDDQGVWMHVSEREDHSLSCDFSGCGCGSPHPRLYGPGDGAVFGSADPSVPKFAFREGSSRTDDEFVRRVTRGR